MEHDDSESSYSPPEATTPSPRVRPRSSRFNVRLGSTASPSPLSKRMSEHDDDEDAHSAKRIRTQSPRYHDAYRLLLNETIRHATEEPMHQAELPLRQSQIGITVWTVEEKETFFSLLPRYGKHGARRIADKLAGKTELQVQEYLILLEQSLEARKSEASRSKLKHRLLRWEEIPASMEMSQACCDILDHAAEALELRQKRHEEHREARRWGRAWLLDTSTTRRLPREMGKASGEDGDRHDIDSGGGAYSTSYKLLNIAKWLDLSSHLFMRSMLSIDDECRTNHIETPSIRATAATDFQYLVIMITKRLIATTLFNTMVRRRASNITAGLRQEVTSADVYTAASILGLPHGYGNYWADCASRHHLAVIDDSGRSLSDQEVRHDLRGIVQNRARSLSRARRRSMSVASEDGIEMHEHRSTVNDVDPIVSDDAEDDLEGPEGQEETLYNNYVEAYDMQRSREEERRLYAMLGLTCPPDPPDAASDSVPPRPAMPRDGAEIASHDPDWRSCTVPYRPWEAFKAPIEEAAFVRNRRLLQAQEKAANTSGPSTDEVDMHSAAAGDGERESSTDPESESEMSVRSRDSYPDDASTNRSERHSRVDGMQAAESSTSNVDVPMDESVSD